MDSPIAFALDYPSVAGARAGATRVAAHVGMLKIGLELFIEAGPEAIRLGDELRLPIFLDLKLHDIPETVERAVARAADLGVRLLTIHAGGGPKMIARAVGRAARASTGLDIAVVTVLTSLDATDLRSTGVSASPHDHVLTLAKMARAEGARAFVCSPEEVRAMREALGDEVTLITPGVRLAGDTGGDDQKRVATPAEAIGDGATILVVGRPIRDARDPVEAASRIDAEARAAREARRSRGATR